MRRYVRELRPTSVLDRLCAMVALSRQAQWTTPRLYPAQARPGAVTYLPPTAEAVSREDVRHLSLPGRHQWPRQGTGRFTVRVRTRWLTPSASKKRDVLQAQVVQVRSSARRTWRAVPHIIDAFVQGVRTVRAVRLQQGSRHLLRPDRLPDRVPQGELHRRVHGERADRSARLVREGGRGHRGVPAHGHRGPPARRSRQRPRLHGRRRRHPLRPAGHQERWPGSDRVDRRGTRRGGQFRSLADFCSRIDLRLVNRACWSRWSRSAR
jgi:hypothetical protein